ncbi:MAG: POTRA domain-containing protein, partial [Cyanobacteria bacterium J06641_5]
MILLMSHLNLQTRTQWRDRAWGLSLVAGFCLVLQPSVSWAQFNDPTPAEPPTSPLPERPPVLETPEIPAPAPLPDVVDTPQAIALAGFAFRGNTAFTQAELQAVLADLVGESVTFNDLLQAANRITAFYVSQGFITTGAYLPSQELEGGTVEIQIVEGRLEDINVTVLEGRLKPGYVRRRIARGAGTPFNINRLQEVLQLLQVDPLIGTIRAELLAGVRPGENVLEVGVASADSFAVKAFLNNERNPVVGTFERGIELTEGNLIGFGDRLSLFYSNTDGSNRFEFGYAVPINATNGRLSFDTRLTDNNLVEPPFDDLDIDINVREFEIGFRQPVLQRASATSAQELSLGVSFARRASDSSILDVDFPVLPGADAEGDIRLSVLQFTQ